MARQQLPILQRIIKAFYMFHKSSRPVFYKLLRMLVDAKKSLCGNLLLCINLFHSVRVYTIKMQLTTLICILRIVSIARVNSLSRRVCSALFEFKIFAWGQKRLLVPGTLHLL